MKKYLSLLFVMLLLTGCSRSPVQKDILAKVNNYEITRSEFEGEFKVSPYGKTDTPESRRDFLNTLIDRKLILQYAQQKDYDKEKGFLRMIEKFCIFFLFIIKNTCFLIINTLFLPCE